MKHFLKFVLSTHLRVARIDFFDVQESAEIIDIIRLDYDTSYCQFSSSISPIHRYINIYEEGCNILCTL